MQGIGVIDHLELKDCHLVLGANGDRLRVKNLFYKGTKDQTPSIIANAFGGDDLIVNHLYCEQVTLETTPVVSAGIMIHNRRPGMKIESLTGYSEQTGTSFISLNNADSNGFSILGGDFKTAQIFINEIIAAGDLNLGGLFLTSSLASGSEIRIKSDNSCISGLSVRRENANSSAVITLSGHNCTVLASGTNLGVGGLLVDTGTGNQTSLLVA